MSVNSEKHEKQLILSRIKVILFLSVLTLMMVGCDPVVIYGAQCIIVHEDTVYVSDDYDELYREYDGGPYWKRAPNLEDTSFINYDECKYLFHGSSEQTRVTLRDPWSENILYRITRDQMIERSNNDGITWEIEYQYEPMTQIQAAYQVTKACYSNFISWPMDAGFDPVTNNFIITMGCHGVLIRDHDTGNYLNQSVGRYWNKELGKKEILDVLGPRFKLLVLLIGLYSALTFRLLFSKHRVLLLVFYALGVCTFIFSALLPPPGYFDFIDDFLGFVFTATSILLAIITVGFTLNFHRYRTVYVFMLLSGILSSVTFLICLMMWGFNMIQDYTLALGITLCASTIITIVCHLVYRKINPRNAPVLDD